MVCFEDTPHPLRAAVSGGEPITAAFEVAASRESAVIGGVTREARVYAVRELLRRAGILLDQYRSSTVIFEDDWTVVHIEPGTRKRIRFRNARFSSGTDLGAAQGSLVRAGWMHSSGDAIRDVIPYFVVPFAETGIPSGRPLFQKMSEDCVDCNLDLPLSALLTLSRFEESQTKERDSHGRFTATMSLAHKHGYLLHPIVDEYGLALGEALCSLLPRWQPAPKRLRVKLSHDLDFVGIPYSLREALGHTLMRHRPSATLRDLSARFAKWNPKYLQLVVELAQSSLAHGLDSAFYWKASTLGPNDSGYDPCHPKIRQVIHWLSDQGIECGIHPGYETYRCRERLFTEIRVIQRLLGHETMGGRQHFLRWCPETWLDWEACGLGYDSTVGFADAVGFRAGTCIPYRPWIIAENREANLLEIPLIVMDCTPVAYMGFTSDESLSVIEACIRACNSVGGVFTLLWHNTTALNRAYGNVYKNLLERLSGAPRFAWEESLQERW
ncbi:MAG: polysaccharide deacetylase family protein [Terriglobales bacterium]